MTAFRISGMMDNSMNTPESETASSVDRIYKEVKAMASAYELRPGERINEGELAKKLSVSRTPLREALNRLSVEGLLEVRSGKGFFRRPLDPGEVFDLYQLRVVIECAAIRLAVQHADEAAIEALQRFLSETGGEQPARTASELVYLDEQFHETLASMSGNAEILRVLRNINARIQFVRWIDIGRRGRTATQAEHMEIIESLRLRDTDRCVAAVVRHIERRLEEITMAIREGFSRIYLSETLR